MNRRTRLLSASTGVAAALGALLIAATPSTATAATPHTFSCALSWQPDVPRATGTLNADGVPADLTINGGSGMTARMIYYFTSPMTPSTARAPFKATPKVFDGHLTAGSTIHPAPYRDLGIQTGAVAISSKAGTVATWKANFTVWPTPVPAAPNAVCTTLS